MGSQSFEGSGLSEPLTKGLVGTHKFAAHKDLDRPQGSAHTWALALLAILPVLTVRQPSLVVQQVLDCIHNWVGQLAAHPYEALLATHLLVAGTIALMCLKNYGRKPAYLLDFYTFRPPNHLQTSNAQVVHGCALTGLYNERSMQFIRRITEISGLGDLTFTPPEVRRGADEDMHEKLSYDGARQETETALFISIEKVLAETEIQPKQIDAVIINCCNFTPVPSLASAVVNRFKLKPSVLSYNLSGMGCTATVIATGLADELLQLLGLGHGVASAELTSMPQRVGKRIDILGPARNHKNMRVLIASSDNNTSGIYQGNQRSMMITNLIFRYGGAAFLMSNHSADRRKAKYQLQHVVRTNMAANDAAYRCVFQLSDDDGIVGVKIGKELMNVAAKAMATNIRELAPLVLPLSEKLQYAWNMLCRKVLKQRTAEYKPDFSKAFDHFCIHTGGKAVIDSVEDNLKLKDGQGDPCRATFERFGNTSSTSTWYNWSYIETKTGVKKGDRVWQLSFGSGFKVASAVWTALKPIKTQHDAWTETPSC